MKCVKYHFYSTINYNEIAFYKSVIKLLNLHKNTYTDFEYLEKNNFINKI